MKQATAKLHADFKGCETVQRYVRSNIFTRYSDINKRPVSERKAAAENENPRRNK